MAFRSSPLLATTSSPKEMRPLPVAANLNGANQRDPHNAVPYLTRSVWTERQRFLAYPCQKRHFQFIEPTLTNVRA